MSAFQVQVVWNREFTWANYGEPFPELKDAIRAGRIILNSGDGARVKKAQVINENGDVVFKL